MWESIGQSFGATRIHSNGQTAESSLIYIASNHVEERVFVFYFDQMLSVTEYSSRFSYTEIALGLGAQSDLTRFVLDLATWGQPVELMNVYEQ